MPRVATQRHPARAREPRPVWHPPEEVIGFQRPQLPPTEAVLEYFRLAEEARFFSNGGPCARLLADRLGAYVGEGALCVPVANCTLGLMAALRAVCGTPDGERRLVITPSFTFTATACAIEWAGFVPLFVDIDPETWQLDPDRLERALAAHPGEVAGVMACAAFGTAPPAETRAAWRAVCDRHGAPLLLDSAPGFGGRDEHGRLLGSHGETEVFSFHATKPFSIGEGGAVITRDPAVAEAVERLINFGLEPGTRASGVVGFNAKLSEIQAATGLAMLDRFDEVLAARRERAGRLVAAVAGTGVRLQAGWAGSTWQFFQVLMPTAEARQRAVELAGSMGVEVRTLHDPALHRQPAFADRPRADRLRVTDAVAARALSLPLANDSHDRELDRVAAVIELATEAS